MDKKNSFKELNLIPKLLSALDKQGYTTPTPIQSKSIPDLLLGRDLIGIAQTGTGKTAAFVLPILQRLRELYPRRIRVLVLAPTRELAAQIGESFSVYGNFLKFKNTVIFGGVGQGKQVDAISKGVDILVATPGRLLDLMNQGKINLKSVEYFVLDEADRMLDMGFIHDMKKVIAKLPLKKQTLFFSATMSDPINKLAKSLLKNPIHVEVTPEVITVELIKQEMFFVDQKSKRDLLLKLLKQEQVTTTLIFTRTKHNANKLSKFLNSNNIISDAIHGNKSQGARTRAISDFKSGKVKVLVATDIAARGIDIDNISHVINFELPNEPESYVHRIGRTARAGAKGIAYSFCAAEERNYLRSIERLIKKKIEVKEHDFHSDTAQNATGDAAKPPPKKFYSRVSRSSRNSGRSSRGNPKPSSNRPPGNRHSGRRARHR
jgi:ATP-dependent RNA helicase RhlE